MHQSEERVELLQKIFENTNHWLQFAEAKNAALIAFNIAVIAAVIGSDLYEKNLSLSSFLVVGVIASTVVTLWSFKPINKELEKAGESGVKENLLHYAYIATLNRDEYFEKLSEKYWDIANTQSIILSQLEKDYCQEIIENARITVRKQKCFTRGFYIILVMMCVLGIAVICA